MKEKKTKKLQVPAAESAYKSQKKLAFRLVLHTKKIQKKTAPILFESHSNASRIKTRLERFLSLVLWFYRSLGLLK